MCVCWEAASVFTSVLRHLAVILLDDTLAQTHGEDHPEELEQIKLLQLNYDMDDTHITYFDR